MLKKRNAQAYSEDEVPELDAYTTGQLQTELRKRFDGADAKLAGSRFELRDGIRAAEVTLIRRAIGYYVNAYTDMRRKVTTQHEKDEHQQYITAALALEDKLLRDLVHIKPKEA